MKAVSFLPAATQMIYDMGLQDLLYGVTFECPEKSRADKQILVRCVCLPVQVRHLGPPVGYYISEIGPLNQVTHMWEYDSLADMEARRAARNADPDWAKYTAASAGFVTQQEDRIIRRVVFKSLG